MFFLAQKFGSIYKVSIQVFFFFLNSLKYISAQNRVNMNERFFSLKFWAYFHELNL